MAARGGGAKKPAAKRKASQGTVAKEQEKMESDVQRIEALEAMVDDLQSSVEDLRKSLKGLIGSGIGDEKIREIISSSIVGEVTEMTDGRIVGWAYSRVDQISPLPISVYYGGKKICSTLSNKTIDGHRELGVPMGKSFSIILPRQFYDGKARSLQIKAGDIEVPIKNKLGAISFKDGFPIEGKVTKNRNGTLGGWAVDHSSPRTPVLISAKYGNEVVAKVVADLKDDSLSKKLGKTNCHHGFMLKLPRRLGDGKKRNFRIVVSPWDYDIIDGPIESKFTR